MPYISSKCLWMSADGSVNCALGFMREIIKVYSVTKRIAV